MGNPRVFFDITIDGAKAGRIIMEVNKRTRRFMLCISSHFKWNNSYLRFQVRQSFEMPPILIFKHGIGCAHAQNSKYIPLSDVLMETPINSGIGVDRSLMTVLINTSIYSQEHALASQIKTEIVFFLELFSFSDGLKSTTCLVLLFAFTQAYEFICLFICSSEVMWSQKLQVGKDFIISSKVCSNIWKLN